jgi:hypothetical protein
LSYFFHQIYGRIPAYYGKNQFPVPVLQVPELIFEITVPFQPEPENIAVPVERTGIVFCKIRFPFPFRTTPFRSYPIYYYRCITVNVPYQHITVNITIIISLYCITAKITITHYQQYHCITRYIIVNESSRILSYG